MKTSQPTHSAPRRRRSRAAAVTLVAAAAITTLGMTSASAAGGFSFSTRTGGDTRVDTAVATSKALYPNTKSDSVVLVNEWSVVDGLSASYLAGLKNAPILFTDTDSVPSATMAEVKRLGATHVWLVGGTSVISSALESQIAGDYTVKRYAGNDRYGTAAAVATAGPYKPERVFVASGTSLADAVTVSPIAWARNYPVLLTKAGSVPQPTADALATLGTNIRTVVGGTTVITDGTFGALHATDRLAGANRAATAVAVANNAVDTAGFTHANAALVGGSDSASIDALAASSWAGNTGTPLLYTAAGGGLAPETAAYLHANRGDLVPGSLGYIFGGTNAISADTVTAANAAAQ